MISEHKSLSIKSYKSVVFVAGAARTHTPMSTTYLQAGDRLSWLDVLVTPAECAGKYITYNSSVAYAICRYATAGVGRLHGVCR